MIKNSQIEKEKNRIAHGRHKGILDRVPKLYCTIHIDDELVLLCRICLSKPHFQAISSIQAPPPLPVPTFRKISESRKGFNFLPANQPKP